MLQIWSQVIPAPDKKFSVTDKVCELHFTDDYVSRFHELTLSDGKVFKVERNFAKLKPGAIPTVFSNFPEYTGNVQNIIDEMRKKFPLHIPEMNIEIDEIMESYFNRISELQETTLSTSEVPSEIEESRFDQKMNLNFEHMSENEMNFDDELDIEEEIISDVDFDTYDEGNVANDVAIKSEAEEGENEADEITFDVLVRNLKSVSKPNSSWSITGHGIFVMCAKWNKEYEPEKRVVIDRDLNIKVFLKNSQIAAYNNCISDIADISNVLHILDK